MPGLDDLVGQEAAVDELRRERARGRLAHAYLFEGLPGSGRLTLARALAAEILCRDGRACGECPSCRLLAGGNHPDLLELPRDARLLPLGRFVERPASRSSDGDDAPPVLPFLHFRPAVAERRVVIVPDAERMDAAAANALLKTLEEPPAAGLLLLTASARERLLPTVVSRCRRVGVRPLPAAAVAAELRRRGAADGPRADDLAALAEGSLGLALTLAEGEAAEDWAWLEEALDARGAGGAQRLARGWIERTRGRHVETAVVRRLAVRWLDWTALALRRRLRAGFDPRRIGAALEILWRAAEHIDRNVSPELALTAAAADCVAELHRRPPRRP